MWDAVFRVIPGRSHEAEFRVKTLKVYLSRNLDGCVTVTPGDETERFLHQPSTEARSAVGGGGDDASDPRRCADPLGREYAQVTAETISVTPGQQMVGLRVASIDIQIGAPLFDDEDLTSQAQQPIELIGAELSKASPGVSLRRLDHRGLRVAVWPRSVVGRHGPRAPGNSVCVIAAGMIGRT
jgi:hypothetical protein